MWPWVAFITTTPDKFNIWSSWHLSFILWRYGISTALHCVYYWTKYNKIYKSTYSQIRWINVCYRIKILNLTDRSFRLPLLAVGWRRSIVGFSIEFYFYLQLLKMSSIFSKSHPRWTKPWAETKDINPAITKTLLIII